MKVGVTWKGDIWISTYIYGKINFVVVTTLPREM